MDQSSQIIPFMKYQTGHLTNEEAGLIVEQSVSLTVNGKVWLSFMCTPSDLEALTVGFLYNENVIRSKEDIASIRICPSQDNVDIWLNYSVDEPTDWRRTSGCTGGLTTTTLHPTATVFHDGPILYPTTINKLVKIFFESQKLHRQVGGVHASALSDGNKLIYIAEDIGRHNTLDKIAGYILLEEPEMAQRILLTTGRISSEMLQKSVRIGAPILISRTSPTTMSVELAHRYGVTLIGYARQTSFKVYTHLERIKQDPESVYTPELSVRFHTNSPSQDKDIS